MTVEQITGAMQPIADQMTAKYNELEEQLKQLQAKSGRIGGSGSPMDMSIKSQIARMIHEDAANLKNLKPGRAYEYRLKDSATMLTSTHLTGNVFTSEINRQPARGYLPFHFRDIVSVVPVQTGSVSYPRPADPVGEGSFQKNTEGQLKSLVDYDVVMVALALKFIAARTKVSAEMLQDLPFLASYLSSSLSEDFHRAEDTIYINALVALAETGTTSETVTYKKVFDYIAQIRDEGHEPNAIVTTPAAWSTLLKTTPVDSAGGLKIADNGFVMIGGKPVFASPLMPTGKCFVGDFSKAAIAQATPLTIRQHESDDDFEKNLYTFRAESRCDLAVYAPKAFVYADV